MTEINNHSENQMPQQPAPMTQAQKSARSLAIAGMVLGIVALFFSFFFFLFFFLSLPCGIVGLILSSVAIKRGEKSYAIAGLVCSILALVVTVIIILIALIFVSAATNQIFNIISCM